MPLTVHYIIFHFVTNSNDEHNDIDMYFDIFLGISAVTEK